MLLTNSKLNSIVIDKRFLNTSSKTLITTILCSANIFNWILSIVSPLFLIGNLITIILISFINYNFIVDFTRRYGISRGLYLPVIILLDFSIAGLGVINSILVNATKSIKR